MSGSPRPILVAPSLLACDFGHLAEEVRKVEEAGADWLHIDVMDGQFVPNLTLGPVVVEAIRRAARIPLDVHLMLDAPQRYLTPFAAAGADWLTVHVEAAGLLAEGVLQETLAAIRKAGVRPGLSLRPATSVERVQPLVHQVDLILVMTVEPGFGGQAFLPAGVSKIRRLREWFAGHIAVDGGITAETGRLCREAGADVMVAGTSVFRAPSYREAIRSLRGGA